jgi:hypothetical protein
VNGYLLNQKPVWHVMHGKALAMSWRFMGLGQHGGVYLLTRIEHATISSDTKECTANLELDLKEQDWCFGYFHPVRRK